MTHFFKARLFFILHYLQFQNNKKGKSSWAKVWEPRQLVLCQLLHRATITACKRFLKPAKSHFNSCFWNFSSFFLAENLKLRNILQPPCMYVIFQISPQILNNVQVWGFGGQFQNLHPSFLEVLHG